MTKLTATKIEVMRQLIAAGGTVEAVARKVGISRARVEAWARREGLVPPPARAAVFRADRGRVRVVRAKSMRSRAVEIPRWVPAALRDDYHRIAMASGEGRRRASCPPLQSRDAPGSERLIAPSFPHRVIIIGEPMHARAEGVDVVLYGPHLRHVATIPDTLRLLRELVVALRIARRARARLQSGERTGPAPTWADPASTNPHHERPAAKPPLLMGPSVHLFAPVHLNAAVASASLRTTELRDIASTNQGQIGHDRRRV